MTARRSLAQRRGVSLVVCIVALAWFASACSVEGTLPLPTCAGLGSTVIVAQSVPTASRVPCFDDLPKGWVTTSVSIDKDSTVIALNSDRAGEGAAVLRFEISCDVSESVPARSDLVAADRYDSIEAVTPNFRASRYYVFDGGCVSWEFDFDASASATESVSIDEAMMLISRTELDDALRDGFVDREL